MAGTLVIDTLNASSGVLAARNGMTGVAKAWVNFNGSTAAINGSFNVSSVTRNGTGDYTVTFTTAMPNANYAVAVGKSGNSSSNNAPGFVNFWGGSLTPTASASSHRFIIVDTTFANIDPTYTTLTVFSA